MFRIRTLLTVLPCGLLGTAFLLWATGQEPPEARQLLLERREVLKQIADLQFKLYEREKAQFTSVVLAQHELVEAELELAEQRAQRIAICERNVTTMQSLEAATQRLHGAAEVEMTDVLTGKAALLKAQARLITERQAGN